MDEFDIKRLGKKQWGAEYMIDAPSLTPPAMPNNTSAFAGMGEFGANTNSIMFNKDMQKGFDMGKTAGAGAGMGMLDKANSYLGIAGSVLSGVGSVYDAIAKKRYQDKIFKAEKNRVNRQISQENQASGILTNVWK
ncbi:MULTISPECIES: hypothetical protein [unclassified Campylobacter]|uniref:hypothetical protein n=1 Tax=unclassified Campylobacter TaxID=2593542 RepID=UPI003D33DB76